ncbi:MAG: hypothetical protein BAJALOKI2v1_70069 [Promethearchaeota archaeon]|nr:MAG: hypothetical protein BAJALOKI2v1_70069 [Candidatus Lokiarchaeota archaeon]
MYSITRAQDSRPRRDNYAYFLTYRFLYTVGTLVGDMTNIPIVDSNDNLNFDKFVRYFKIRMYKEYRARYDDPDRIFINDDARDNVEVLREHINKIYNKLKDRNFEGLANLVEEMGDSLVYELKNLYNVKDKLEQYPDATRPKLLKKILYSPFCPPIFKKIASDSLIDFVEKILHRKANNLLIKENWKKEFRFSTLNSILYGISCLTPDYFKRQTPGEFKGDYDVSWDDIKQFVRHVRTVVYRYHKDRGYINFDYLDISPRSKEYVYKQYNTIDLFMLAYHAHDDAFSDPKLKISPSDLHDNDPLFRNFMKLTRYVSRPYRLSNKGFSVMKKLLHSFINEARANLRDRTDPHIAIRQLSLYKEALKSVDELQSLKADLEAEFEKGGWITLQDDQSNYVEFLGNLFVDIKTKVRGWHNTFYTDFSHLMLFWEQGGMGADGNLISDMFLRKLYTQVRQHMVQGSNDPRRVSLLLALLTLINSRSHPSFETLDTAAQKRIKRGLRRIFEKGIENGAITPQDWENEFGKGKKEEKFRISIKGKYSYLTLRDIWVKLDQQKMKFDEKLAAWSKIAEDFHDALKEGENPYKAIIKGTPLEGAKYENAIRFMKTLFAYENLRLREMKLPNTKDATIPQILTPSFNPDFRSNRLPRLYDQLFDKKFPDLLSEFGNDFHKFLMVWVIDLDDLD